MTWSMVQKLIDADDSIESLLKEPGFWESEEAIFIRAATALREKGRFREATQLIQRLVGKEDRVSQKTYVLLNHIHAECLLDQRLFAKAISIYDSILSRVKDATAYANRGLGHWELRQYKLALSDYLAALRLTPKDAVAHRSAGELLNKMRKYSQAVKHLKKAIQLNPRCSRSFCALGVSYYAAKDWLKAYRALKKAVKLDPTNKTAQLGVQKIEDHFELS
jgi:tetratricopeptide (TPR) repeat protein